MNKLLFLSVCGLWLLTGCVPPQNEIKEEGIEVEGMEVKDEEVNEAKKYYSFCREYYKNRMYDEAIKNCCHAIEDSASYVDAYVTLALTYRAKKDYVEMENIYKKLIEVAPIKGHYALGRLYSDKKEYDNALIEYNKALESDTSYVDALYGIGYVYEKMGKPEAAIKEYKRALKLAPENEGVRYSLGKAYISNKEYEKGIKELEILREAHLEDLDVRRALGDALLSIKKYEKAKKEFEYVAVHSPSDIGSRINLGKAYEGLKDYSGAAQSYKEAISIDTTNTSLYCHLVNFYVKLKKSTDAIKVLKVAKQIDPNNQILYCLAGDVQSDLGSIAFKSKNYSSAKSRYNKAVEEYKNALTGSESEWITYSQKAIKRAKIELKKIKEAEWWDRR